MMTYKHVIPFVFFLASSLLYAQETNIVQYLKQVEAGDIKKVKNVLRELKAEHPDDPSVIFLDAILTEDGEKALGKYEKIVNSYPSSNYADAALYRVFSYYFAVGLYKRAGTYLDLLKKNYAKSPYLKFADRTIPESDINLFNQTTQIKTSPVKKISVRNFSIQVGAFMNIDNAKNLRSLFEKNGFKSDIKPKTVAGSILNVVTVGNYRTRKETEENLKLIFDKFKIKGRIVEKTN